MNALLDLDHNWVIILYMLEILSTYNVGTSTKKMHWILSFTVQNERM